ncbi:MAG: hypothetical protein ABR572_13150 [Cryomorphaceae bacterium]
MKNTAKKVIAREFLVLLGSIIFFVLVVVFWNLMIEINRQKTNDVAQEMRELTKYEEMPYRLKTLYYMNKNFPINSYKIRRNKENYIHKLKNKNFSSAVFYTLYQANSISVSVEEFQYKCLEDQESEWHLKNLRYFEKKSESLKNSLFAQNLKDETIFITALIIISLSFLLRYIVYATIWSINQLKR